MEIFQHPIQIHQIILRLHSSSHTREKVSINLTMKKSLSRQRRRASTQQKAAIRDKFKLFQSFSDIKCTLKPRLYVDVYTKLWRT